MPITSILDAARQYAAAGLSVIPIRLGGLKAPAVDSWERFEREIAGADELTMWFSRNVGIAIVGGAVSGGLEILDFDKPGLFDDWLASLAQLDPEAHAVAESLPRVGTPAKGMHVYFRCDKIGGSQKLARARAAFTDCVGKQKTTLIETKGEGGYVLAPPSPASCHAANMPYERIGGAELTAIPRISERNRQIFFQAARAYNEIAVAARQNAENHALHGAGRPGDDFNSRGPTWSAILEPHGWTFAGARGDSERWRRPGKTEGISATSGHCGDKLYVFSSNADPFDSERAYDKFAAWTLLNHEGDFVSSTRELGKSGYGERPSSKPSNNPPDDDVPHTVDTQTDIGQQVLRVQPMGMGALLDLWVARGDNQSIPTPLKCLDEVLGGGWPVGQVTIVKAYAKVGKSEFCRQSALAAAAVGYPIIYVDVELGAVRLAERILSQASNIPPTRLRKKSEMDAEETKQLDETIKALRPDILMQFICPGGAVPLDQLDLAIRQALAETKNGKPALLVLDSAQRLAKGATSRESFRMQVTEFMCAVTSSAMSMNAAVILVSEERRGADGKAPTSEQAMTSGAESRSIEFQSDVMLCLYNEDKGETTEACAADAEGERKVQIYVATNRNGSGTGFLPDSVVFEAPCWGMRVEQRKKQEIEEMIIGALSPGEENSKSVSELAKELHRRKADVLRASNILIDGKRLAQKGCGCTAKIYRPGRFPNPGTDFFQDAPEPINEEPERQLILP